MAASFRTELNVSPSPYALHLHSNIITLGSCFAEVMGQRFHTYKVNVQTNPFGTIFNPLSLFKLLEAALKPESPFTGELVERDSYWYAYDLPSSFAAKSKVELLNNIQQVTKQVNTFLRTADALILTFGTAVGYLHKESNQLVANCHKIPQQYFQKKLLSTAEITTAFVQLYKQLKVLNPKLQIIITVSPVRHLKETLELNSVSKSILRVACHEIKEQFADVQYFPAYEIVMDDLRDYRFYKRDMLHPTEEAEDYIWQKFMQAYFDQTFQKFTQDWDKIRQASAHKPFVPEAPAHQQFLQNTLLKLEQLHATVNCTQEIEQIKRQLL